MKEKKENEKHIPWDYISEYMRKEFVKEFKARNQRLLKWKYGNKYKI